jgi:phenylpropionate dioxygenase-like ring-hydroxylating dioxygenase large terminal subunit
LDQKLHDTVTTIFNEDKGLLEAQQRSMETAPPEFRWIDVNADAGGVQARRALEAALEREAASRRGQAAE